VARRLTNRKDLTAAEERISLIMAQRARHVGLVVWSEYGKYSLTGVEYKKKKRQKEKRKEKENDNCSRHISSFKY